MSTALSDENTRTEVATSTDRSFVVVAGAGTGKTKVLADRITSVLIGGDTKPEEVVAITFTEAAASELAERVRIELLSRLDAAQPGAPERTVLESVLSRLDGARISTIHGFAQSIVSEFALQAGVPVEFRVAEPTVYFFEVQRRWREFVKDVSSGADGARLAAILSALGFDLGRESPRLVPQFAERALPLVLPRRLSIARTLSEDDDPDTWPAESLWEKARDCLVPPVLEMLNASGIFDAARALDDCVADSQLPHRGAVAGTRCRYIAQRLVQWASSEESPEMLYNTVVDLGALARSAREILASISRRKQPPPAADPAETLANSAEQILASTREHCANSVLALMGRFVADETRRRRRDGTLTFDDLLTIALELLETRPDIRHRISQRYKCFLIDEFQDTDPVQVLLAFSIAGLCATLHTGEDPAECSLSHDDHRPDPDDGRLVVVGDLKQAIYSFRGATPAVLDGLSKRWPIHLRRLESNFRCRPEIVGFVNAVFETAFSGGDREGQAIYEPLSPARSPAFDSTGDASSLPRIRLIGGPREAPAEEIRTEEIFHIADLIEEATGRTKRPSWPVEKYSSEGEAGLEPARLGDIAVLIRGRTWLPAIERVFTARGVPYRLETGSLLYSTQEAADIRAVLRCIEDPTDAIGVVAALKSPMFACSDQDLLDYFVSMGRTPGCWEYTSRTAVGLTGTSNPRMESSSRSAAAGVDYVISCMEDLRDLYRDARRMSPPRLLERLVRRRRVFEGALLGRYREQWRRYRLIIEDCRRFFEETGGSIADFLEWMNLVRENYSAVAENICPEPDEDSVRVLTIHGAKGLEFPIVFAVGAVGDRGLRAYDSVLQGPDGTIELKLGARGLGIETSGYNELADTRRLEDVDEDVRLGYVAFTRARDHLVVSLYSKATTRTGDPPPVREAIEAILDSAGVSAPSNPEPSPGRSDVEFDWGILRVEPYRDADATPDDSEERRAADGHLVVETPPSLQERTRLVLQSLGSQRDGLALRPPVFSASELASMLAPYDFGRPAKQRGVDHSGRGDPLALGRAVHDVLARLDLSAGPSALRSGLTEAVRGVVDSGDYRGVTEEGIRSLAERALEIDIVAGLRAARHWKELYICAPGPGGTAVEGFADLVIEEGEGLVVADYKTDSLSLAADPDGLRAHYATQLAAYAYALGSATGRPVTGCYLLFLGDPEPVAVEIEDPSARMAEIEDLLQELSETRDRVLAEAQLAKTTRCR